MDFQDSEAAAAALIRWAENRASRKLALLREQLAARDQKLENVSHELMQMVQIHRNAAWNTERYTYLRSREAV